MALLTGQEASRTEPISLQPAMPLLAPPTGRVEPRAAAKAKSCLPGPRASEADRRKTSAPGA